MKTKRILISSIAALSLLMLAPALMAKSEKMTHGESHRSYSHHAKKPVETAKVDVNTASVAELSGLKRIGEKKAAAIVAYRNQHGAFKSIKDLTNVKGLSQGIVDVNKAYLTLS